jgi:succinate-acetate transporter protein
MAVGNTFGATALSSYGGFWLSFAIVLTPGGFDIVASYATTDATTGKATGAGVEDFNNAFGFFLIGWFIFTTVLLICTLRSTVAFFLLFFFLDMAFLLLAIARFQAVAGAPNVSINKAGGYFGIFAAFMAWYNALAGIADDRYVPYLSWKFSHFTRRLLIDEQQLLLRHPRRAFPLVRQRPRDERRQQDGARDRLSASRDCYLPSICVIYSSCYTSEEWCFHTYTRKVLDGWGTGHRGVLFHGNETVLFMIKIGVQTCD